MYYFELVVLAFIPLVMGGIGAYFVGSVWLKKVKSAIPDILLDNLDQILPELPKLLAKDEVRQFVYSIGVLAGTGAKAGALGQVGKGKFKWENLLAEFAPQVIQSILPKILPMNQQQGEQQQSPQEGKW